jgi:Fe(3+) dicitrate transport protein
MKLRFINIGLAVLLLLGSSAVAFAADTEENSSETSTVIEVQELTTEESSSPTSTVIEVQELSTEESSSTTSAVIEVEELDSNEILMQEVSIIGSKFNIKNIAGSAAYLDVQDIRKHGVADINRVLRRVPGVTLRQEDGFGLFPNISLRGVDSSRSAKLTIMEDGVLTAPAPYSAPDAYYSPTTARMSGLEVLKGSSQVKYGPRTTGGVINFLSTSIPTTEKYYMKASYGTFDELRNHTYFGNTEHTDSGKFGYVVEYYTRNNSGFKNLDDNIASIRAEADTGINKKEPMIKLSYEPKSSAYQRFEFKYGHTDLDANETYLGLTTEDFRSDPDRRYAASRFDEINSEHHRSYLRHFLEINSNTDFVTTIYGNTFHRNWQKLDTVNGNSLDTALLNATDIATLKGGAGTLKLRNNNRSYYLYGVQGTLKHKAQIGATEHNIEVGLRYHYDQIRRFQKDETFTQDANGAITAVTVGDGGAAGNVLQETDAVALNIQDAIKWGKFTFTPGIRTEYIVGSYENYANGRTGTKGYVALVGGGSLKYDLFDSGGEDIDLFGGIFRGFSPPDPKSAFENGLREETSLGYEAGVRYKNALNAFSTEAILFLTDTEDLIVRADIGDTSNGQTINGGEVRSYGVEFQANYDHGLAKNWKIQTPTYASFTYTNAKFEENIGTTSGGSIFAGAVAGNKVPYISDYVLSMGTGVIYNKFNVNFDANYTSEAFADGRNLSTNLNTSSTGSERFGKIDEQWTIDAALGYQINNKVRLFSNFKNITNSRFIVSRQPAGPRPNLPFAMMAGMEFAL